jgi:hypothetical protein
MKVWVTPLVLLLTGSMACYGAADVNNQQNRPKLLTTQIQVAEVEPVFVLSGLVGNRYVVKS